MYCMIIVYEQIYHIIDTLLIKVLMFIKLYANGSRISPLIKYLGIPIIIINILNTYVLNKKLIKLKSNWKVIKMAYMWMLKLAYHMKFQHLTINLTINLTIDADWSYFASKWNK